jgi:hypothetical protein
LVLEQKLKELQEEVGHFMIDILRQVIPENEESGAGRVVKAIKGVEEDIKRLLR